MFLARMFNQLPHETNREIGSFLDYNSRLNFFAVLSDKEDKFTRKINSNAHNLYVKKELLIIASNRVQNSNTTRKRAIELAKLFRYLAKTKDTCILDSSFNVSFKETIIKKAFEFSDIENPQFAGLHSRIVKDVIRASNRLIKRLITYFPKKIITYKPICLEII